MTREQLIAELNAAADATNANQAIASGNIVIDGRLALNIVRFLAQPERGTCATCQWWTGRDVVSSPTWRRKCLANDETQDMCASGTLWTSPDFGCSLHQPTEQPSTKA